MLFIHIKRAFFLILIFACAWVPARPLIPPQYLFSPPAMFFDGIVNFTGKQLLPITNKIFGTTTSKQIIEVNAEQVEALIKSIQHKKSLIIVYIYSLDCQICHINFVDINKLGDEYKGLGINVLALAVDDDRARLKEFIGKKDMLSFKPLMINSEEARLLAGKMRGLNSSYSQPPYIAILDKKNLFNEIKAGILSGSKIKEALENAL